ncbi:hypothetical protein MXD81_60475 [Microbacteriaceae bacterium K1510]|nr:hypothetical protein [Microbacteriaceae bacterium K1510]
MITVRQFVGALLEEVTKARAISDAASARIAQQYLKHDLLKGFPVPRMHVREIELELCFAIGPNTEGASMFDDGEVRQNIRHQLRHLLEDLPDQPDVAPHFASAPDLKSKWTAGLEGLDQRFDQAMTRKDATRVAVVNALSMIIENYLYETVSTDRGLLARVARVWRNPANAAENQPINDAVREQVRNIIVSLDTIDTEGEVVSDLLDLNILVESADLEKLNPSRIQKMKLVFNASDRRWVASEVDGQKTHILGKS